MCLVLPHKQCFSHGQVYVAFSRVKTIDGIRIFSPKTCRGNSRYIKNTVYTELLDENDRPRTETVAVRELHYSPNPDYDDNDFD